MDAKKSQIYLRTFENDLLTYISSHGRAIAKVILWGSGGCGKTTLMKKILEGEFSSETPLTRGIDIYVFEAKCKEMPLILQVYDFAGEERWRAEQELLLSGTMCAVIAYDIMRNETFSEIPYFLNIIRDHIPECPVLLVGMKSDTEERAVDIEEVLPLVGKNGVINAIEVSAKTGKNVSTFKEMLVDIVCKRIGELVEKARVMREKVYEYMSSVKVDVKNAERVLEELEELERSGVHLELDFPRGVRPSLLIRGWMHIKNYEDLINGLTVDDVYKDMDALFNMEGGVELIKYVLSRDVPGEDWDARKGIAYEVLARAIAELGDDRFLKVIERWKEAMLVKAVRKVKNANELKRYGHAGAVIVPEIKRLWNAGERNLWLALKYYELTGDSSLVDEWEYEAKRKGMRSVWEEMVLIREYAGRIGERIKSHIKEIDEKAKNEIIQLIARGDIEKARELVTMWGGISDNAWSGVAVIKKADAEAREFLSRVLEWVKNPKGEIPSAAGYAGILSRQLRIMKSLGILLNLKRIKKLKKKVLVLSMELWRKIVWTLLERGMVEQGIFSYVISGSSGILGMLREVIPLEVRAGKTWIIYLPPALDANMNELNGMVLYERENKIIMNGKEATFEEIMKYILSILSPDQ